MGLMGLGGFLTMDWNVIGTILPSGFLLDTIYILIGLSGVVMLTGCKCKACKSGACGGSSCGSDNKKMEGGMDMHSADDGHDHGGDTKESM